MKVFEVVLHGAEGNTTLLNPEAINAMVDFGEYYAVHVSSGIVFHVVKETLLAAMLGGGHSVMTMNNEPEVTEAEITEIAE